MELQNIINAVFGILITIVGVLIGIIYTNLIRRQEKNEDELDEVKKEIHEIDKVISGEYIKRDEVDKHMEKIDIKLDKIFDKLNGKADK